MHTVLGAECNGCELCLAACPVDCILMQARVPDEPAPTAADNRRRYDHHRKRDARLLRERQALLSSRKQAARARPPQ
jgi:Na+-translocating ferredoxin:NAD+ oxidoreductase subunit B